jgi:hypothetical protein
MKTRISGKEAARVAEDMAKPGPIRVVEPREVQEAAGALVPSAGSELDRKVPPRVRKPLPRNDQWKAPTPDLEGHRKRLREALGNTLSEKLVEALRPGLYDQLDEATLNAALATIDSMQPRSELQAILAVQIIATGFAGLRFLRQSHRNMTEDFINVYGNYAIKLLRLQNESRGAARPHTSRGAGSGRDHKSTRRSRRGCARMRHGPMRQADIEQSGQSPAVWGANASRSPL